MHRCEAYEPRMILVLFSADLFLGNDLSGAGLAAGVQLARKAYASRGSALVHHTPHAVVDGLYC